MADIRRVGGASKLELWRAPRTVAIRRNRYERPLPCAGRSKAAILPFQGEERSGDRAPITAVGKDFHYLRKQARPRRKQAAKTSAEWQCVCVERGYKFTRGRRRLRRLSLDRLRLRHIELGQQLARVQNFGGPTACFTLLARLNSTGDLYLVSSFGFPRSIPCSPEMEPPRPLAISSIARVISSALRRAAARPR